MARERKAKDEFITVTSFKIRRAFEYKKTNTLFFDLELNGVTIYGCRVVSVTDKAEFIGFPSEKGKDGKYYDVVYAKISAEDQKKIIDAVYDMLDR